VPEAPATWEEVREISTELVESGASQYGFMLQTGDAYHGFPVLASFGGYIFERTEDGTFNAEDIGYDSEGGLASAEWLASMYEAGLMTPDWDSDTLLEAFRQGDVAMWMTGPWNSGLIEESGVPYAIDPIPGVEGVTEQGAPPRGVQGFIISAFSEQQLLAEAFLYDFVATDETMQAIFDASGRIPAWASVDFSADPTVDDFIAAGETAIPMPSIPEMGAVWSAAGNAYTLLSTGSDPAETFETATEQIEIAIGNLNAPVETVTLVGSLQDELGCDAEWTPECEATFMENEGGGSWLVTFEVPAGDYEYKVALNGTWDRNYPGNNIVLSLEEDTEVTFRYNQNTNAVTDSVNNPPETE
jgi:maltose-binding protein MalE